MSIERRSILKGAVALACGSSLGPVSAASPDPLIALIREYQIGTAEFNARSASENWDGLTEATYGPSMDRLCTSPPKPTTFAGALVGIEFVLSEMQPSSTPTQMKRSSRSAPISIASMQERQHESNPHQ